MAFSLNIGKCSLLGNYRENNEDSIDVKVFPDLTVNIVADGMGGQAAGEIASRKSVDIIPPFCKLLSSSEVRIQAVVLDGLKNILKNLSPRGDSEALADPADDSGAAYARVQHAMDECGGLDLLESLQVPSSPAHCNSPPSHSLPGASLTTSRAKVCPASLPR